MKKKWELRTVDDFILVVPKNGVGTTHIYEELARGENRAAYQKFVMSW